MVNHHSILSSRGFIINMDLYGTHLPQTAPFVIYLHGFKGFKDWGFVPATGEVFTTRGLRFLAINFSHNGIGNVMDQFTEVQRFRDNTFSLELEEALEVIAAVHDGSLPGIPQGTRTGLLGHSRGGGIALLAASGNAAIQCVCTWAAVSTFRRYPDEVIDRWRKQGYLEVTNARTGQVMQLGWNLHADLLKHLDGKLNIGRAVREMTQPLCIIHGQDDEAVSVADAKAVHEWAGDQASLHIIQAAGHTFGAKHPWAGSNPMMDEVLDITTGFFSKQLAQGKS